MQHHPAASRVVPHLVVGLSPKRVFQMLKGCSRRGEKAGKARCLAAKEAPRQPEQQQGEHRVADPSVPDHPVQSPRRIGSRDKRHDEPVEDADKNVPHENDARRSPHRLTVSAVSLRRLSQDRPLSSTPAMLKIYPDDPIGGRAAQWRHSFGNIGRDPGTSDGSIFARFRLASRSQISPTGADLNRRAPLPGQGI